MSGSFFKYFIGVGGTQAHAEKILALTAALAMAVLLPPTAAPAATYYRYGDVDAQFRETDTMNYYKMDRSEDSLFEVLADHNLEANPNSQTTAGTDTYFHYGMYGYNSLGVNDWFTPP